MQKVPLVSIVTPTYNRENFIEQTIISILSQKYPKLEFIIVDDGSTDNTAKVVKKYKKKIKYIRRNKNIGEIRSVNEGFFKAKGEIIVYVSSDDTLLPGAVSLIVGYMVKHPEFLAVYPYWEKIDENSNIVEVVKPENYDYIKMIREHYCMPGPGTFFKKKCLELTGGKNTNFKYVADFAFWLKIGMYRKMARFPKVLATLRVHPGSQGIYAKDKIAEEHSRLVDAIYADPDLPKEALRVKRAAYASAYFHAATESGSLGMKSRYLFLSLITNPFTFLGKLIYEGIKIKKSLGL